MAIKQEPVISAWFINLNGQFMKVWGVVYNHGFADKVIIQYLNGMRFVVDLPTWFKLDLERQPNKEQMLDDAKRDLS